LSPKTTNCIEYLLLSLALFAGPEQGEHFAVQRLAPEFAPRGGSKIDPASVKVEYLRGSGVDLTERLKASINPEGIEVASAQVPAGEHAFRVSVRDSEGREGKTEFKLTVK
jgi:hypothetical protein